MPYVAKHLDRDALVPFRTFAEVRERLDATAILRGRGLRGRSGLIEYYVIRGLERDEEDMGLVDGRPFDAKGRPLGILAALSRAQRETVLDHYRRIDEIALRRLAGQKAGEAARAKREKNRQAFFEQAAAVRKAKAKGGATPSLAGAKARKPAAAR